MEPWTAPQLVEESVFTWGSQCLGHEMTGSQLRHHRKSAGLSQHALARRAGVSRDAVRYWEAKAEVDARGWAPRRFFNALGLMVYPPSIRARAGRGFTAIDDMQARLDAEVERRLTVWCEQEARRADLRRVRCGARTRKGTPCRSLSEPGRRRCRFHGGKSTGPQTPEGLARIAEAQRRRWARWRQEHGRAPTV